MSFSSKIVSSIVTSAFLLGIFIAGTLPVKAQTIPNDNQKLYLQIQMLKKQVEELKELLQKKLHHQAINATSSHTFTYRNEKYDFSINLPKGWDPQKTVIKDTSIITNDYYVQWNGISLGYQLDNSKNDAENYPLFNIYIIPIKSWVDIDQEVIWELGRNEKYVFGLSPENNLLTTNNPQSYGSIHFIPIEFWKTETKVGLREIGRSDGVVISTDKSSRNSGNKYRHLCKGSSRKKQASFCSAYSELEVLVDSKSSEAFGFKTDITTGPITPPIADWKSYSNSRYGFQMKLPMYHFQDYFTQFGYEHRGGTGNSSGKDYNFTQIASGNPNASTSMDITIIEKLGDPLLQPFGKLNQFYKIPTIHTTSLTTNGVQWELFYNPKQTMGGCEYSFAQTLMSNDDVLTISISDNDTETQCPGTLETSNSQPLLKQILSTFKFSEVK